MTSIGDATSGLEQVKIMRQKEVREDIRKEDIEEDITAKENVKADQAREIENTESNEKVDNYRLQIEEQRAQQDRINETAKQNDIRKENARDNARGQALDVVV